MEPIGRRIRQRREELGLQQGELAKLAKINKGTLNAIEKGYRRRPSTGTLEQLAPHLKWSLSELLDPAAQPAETASHAPSVDVSETMREVFIDIIEEIHAALVHQRTPAPGGQTTAPRLHQSHRPPLRRKIRG